MNKLMLFLTLPFMTSASATSLSGHAEYIAQEQENSITALSACLDKATGNAVASYGKSIASDFTIVTTEHNGQLDEYSRRTTSSASAGVERTELVSEKWTNRNGSKLVECDVIVFFRPQSTHMKKIDVSPITDSSDLDFARTKLLALEARARKVLPGMTDAQLIKFIGEPTAKSESPGGWPIWLYGSRSIVFSPKNPNVVVSVY